MERYQIELRLFFLVFPKRIGIEGIVRHFDENIGYFVICNQIGFKLLITYFIFDSPRNSVRWTVDCPLLKWNQAPHPKFEIPNGKILRSNFFFTSVKNWCVQLTWKLNEAISLKIWLKTNESKWKSMTFLLKIDNFLVSCLGTFSL